MYALTAPGGRRCSGQRFAAFGAQWDEGDLFGTHGREFRSAIKGGEIVDLLALPKCSPNVPRLNNLPAPGPRREKTKPPQLGK